MSDKQLLERIARLSPEQRDKLLKQLKEKKQQSKGAGGAAADVDEIHTIPLIERLSSANATQQFPLSYAQKRLWFIDRLEGKNDTYNQCLALKVDGTLSIPALNFALQRLIDRHESLRTTFDCEVDTGEPAQIVSAQLKSEWALTDLSALQIDSGEGEVAARHASQQLDYAIAHHVNEDAHTLFDLSTGPLFKAHALRISAQQHVLVLTMHHIISDGWSMDVMLREVFSYYKAQVDGLTEFDLPALSVQYPDYAVWQQKRVQGDALIKDLAFWRQQLKSMPQLHSLPMDHPRPAVERHQGALYRQLLPAPLSASVEQSAKHMGVTQFVFLLTAFKVLLARLSGESDQVVGTPASGRSQQALESLIGFFVNTLVMRTQVDTSLSFEQLLDRVKGISFDAMAHQHLPFDVLVDELAPERSLSHSPLFQIMFVVQNNVSQLPGVDRGGQLKLGDLSMSPLEYEHSSAKFDLTLTASPSSEHLELVWEYNTDLFEAERIGCYAQCFESLLKGFINDAGQACDRIPLLADIEVRELYKTLNDTHRDYPKDQTLIDLFEQTASQYPDRIAIEMQEKRQTPETLETPRGPNAKRLRYDELNQLANGVALNLQKQGFIDAKTQSIMVLCDRGIDNLVSIVATLKLGLSYVSCDAAYPDSRILHMIRNASISCILSQGQHLDRLQTLIKKSDELQSDTIEGAVRLIDIDRWISASSDSSVTDAAANNLELQDVRAQRGIDPQSVAQMIYTSGSTGVPKGVCTTHQGIIRLVSNTNYLDFSKTPRIAHVANTAFDACTYEIWSALLNGNTLCTVPKNILLDSSALLENFKATKPSTVLFTTALFNVLVDSCIELFRYVDTVLIGGEAAERSKIRKVQRQDGSARIINAYGPSENAVIATTFDCDQIKPEHHAVPIGRPIANTQVYILDEYLQAVPRGVVGELYCAGDGLADGYHELPERSAESFISAPQWITAISPDTQRLYRTGDHVLLDHDENIVFVGRADAQVKIRGFRIELSEVEHHLLEHPAVDQACVVVSEPETGEKQLLAYVVLNSLLPVQDDPSALRRVINEKLQAHLPSYMLPDHYMALETLPMTANGKLDYRALPSIERQLELEETFVEASTDTERELQTLWQSLLKRERISTESNFFSLGGHSLLVTRLTAQIKERLGITVSLKAVFSHPTIASLAHHIDQQSAEKNLPSSPQIVMKKAEAGQRIPLSYAQQRLWFLYRLEPGSGVYNIPIAVRLKGAIRREVLEAALNDVIEQQDILRTVYQESDDIAEQIVRPDLRLSLGYEDHQLAGVGDDVSLEQLTARVIDENAAWVAKPFDLGNDLMLRAKLLRYGADDFVFIAVIHHIAADGWSMQVFSECLFKAYRYRLAGSEHNPLPALRYQYADYALWQRQWLRGDVLNQELVYWSQQLQDIPAVHALPLDYVRPAQQRFEGAIHRQRMPLEVANAVRVFADAHDVTLFMALQAVFAIWIARVSGENDIVMGTPVANRQQQVVDEEGGANATADMIGFFVNTLVLRSEVASQSFSELLAQTREQCLSAYEHQQLPFETLVDHLNPTRSLSYSPLFQVFFAVQRAQSNEALNLPGLSLEALPLDDDIAKFDLQLVIVEDEQGLECVWQYNRHLFAVSSIAAFADQYRYLLNDALRQPERNVQHLALLNPEHAQRWVVGHNQTYQQVDDVCLHQRFESRVDAQPDAMAMQFQGRAMSYDDLNRSANQLAHHLIEQGTRVGDRVGLFCERSFEMNIAMLAIMKAGAAYVPLEPSLPNERISVIVDDADIRVVITKAQVPMTLSAADTSNVLRVIDLNDALTKVKIEAHSETNPSIISSELNTESLAYVMYTSGSTGKPKGVMVPHRGVVNSNAAMQALYPINAEDRVLQKTPFSFDVSVSEWSWSLCYGACLVIAEPESHKDANAMAQLIEDAQVTVLHMVPSMLAALLRYDQWQRCASVRYVLCVGEIMPRALVDEFYAYAHRQHCLLVNLYGPTEASIYHTAWNCEPGAQHHTVPIGVPYANTSCYVLDSNHQIVPPGVVGELYLGGAGVANGYLNRPELNAQVFLNDPFAELTPISQQSAIRRLYRTGDFARYQQDGQLQYVGRADQQVKLRGYRIELAEIEAVLQLQDCVDQAVVIVRNEELLGFVMLRDVFDTAGSEEAATETSATLSSLGRALEAALPSYMVPQHLIRVDEWPYTTSGKINRKALPSVPAALTAGGGEQAMRVGRQPTTALQQQLLGIWQQLFSEHAKNEVVVDAIDANFFELGGHSILAIRLLTLIREQLNLELPLRAVFEAPSIELMASFIERFESQVQLPPITALSEADRPESIPLSFAQHRLWFVSQLEKSVAYNMPMAIRVRGEFNHHAANRAVAALAYRHESLRSVFLEQDGLPYVEIASADAFIAQNEMNGHHWLGSIDLSHLSDQESESVVQETIKNHASTLFDTATGPLWSATLVKLPEAQQRPQSILLLNMHHIVSDAWSLQVLLSDFASLYSLALHDSMTTSPLSVKSLAEALTPLSITYSDYAVWQRQHLQGETLQRLQDYWVEKLNGANAQLNLPTDHSREDMKHDRQAAHYAFEFDPQLSQRIETFCEAHQMTPYTVLMAGYQALLSRYCQTDDVCVGTPIAGRHQSGTESLIGFFVSALLIRTDFSDNPSVISLCRQVRETFLDAFAHQDLPADVLFDALNLDRGQESTPGAQVAFAYQANMSQRHTQLAGLEAEVMQPTDVIAKHDCLLFIDRVDGVFKGLLEYRSALFDESTVARWARHFVHLMTQMMDNVDAPIDSLTLLASNEAAESVALSDSENVDVLPLSAMQRDIALDALIHPDSQQNMLGMWVDFDGNMDANAVAQLTQILQSLTDQQSMLRTGIRYADVAYGDIAYQVVSKNKLVRLTVKDISAMSLSADQIDAFSRDLAYQTRQNGIDINGDDLLRYSLVKLDSNRSRFILSVHHVILDGVGAALHMKQIMEAFKRAQTMPEVSLLSGADDVGDVGDVDDVVKDGTHDNYAEYVNQSRVSFDNEQTLQYWKTRAHDLQALDFVVSANKPVSAADHVLPERVERFHTIEPTLWKRMKPFCKQRKVSQALLMRGVYGLLIEAYCQPDSDFWISDIHGGRDKPYRQSLGCYFQNRPVVFSIDDLAGETRIDDWFDSLLEQKRLTDRYDEISLQRQASLLPQGRLQFMFNYYHFLSPTLENGESLDIVGCSPIVNGPVQLVLMDRGDQLDMALVYDAHVFRSHALLQRIEAVIEQLLSESVHCLADLDLILPEEQGSVLDRRADVERSRWQFLDAYRNVIAQQPQALAIIDGERRYSYERFDRVCTLMRDALRRRGLGAKDAVMMALPKSIESIALTLACALSGIRYIPVDAKAPPARIEKILAESGATLCMLVAQQHQHIDDERVVDFDEWSERIKNHVVDDEMRNALKPSIDIGSDHPLYTIFTSGSTGVPKGVSVSVDGFNKLLQWYVPLIDNILQDQAPVTMRNMLISAMGFDLTQKNLFATFASAGCLVLPRNDEFDVETTVKFIDEQNVNVINAAPSVFGALLEPQHYEQLASLQAVVLGGEAIQRERIDAWFSSGSCKASIVNSYGPSECTDVVAYYPLPKAASAESESQAPIPVGSPIAGACLSIVDRQRRVLPMGLSGELLISGDPVGLGYRERSQMRNVFIDHKDYGASYCSGDRMVLDADHRLVYLGRKDYQVKLRGLRIELGEIESTLKACTGIEDAIAVVKDEQLLAYVLLVDRTLDFDCDAVMSSLRASLPVYMVPHYIQSLLKWPLTPNGKIDRKALPDPADGAEAKVEYVAPSSDTEQQLVDIWCEILNLERVGVNDNFFAIGGHSLLAARAISKFRHAFDVEIPLSALFERHTVAEIAEYIEALQWAKKSASEAQARNLEIGSLQSESQESREEGFI